MNRKTPFWKQGLVLLVILVIGIVLGRFVLVKNTQYVAPQSQSVTVASPKTSEPVVTPVMSSKVSPTVSSKPTTQSTLASCISTVTSEVQKNKTEYEKGTIVVSFVAGTSFTQAKTVLANYNTRVENEAQAQGSYPSNRVVTAVVTSGQEITKACQLRQDKVVYYAGLNTIIELHE